MGEPHKSKLTDYLIEALAKSHTEEGRQELLEASAILDAEAQREAPGGRPAGEAASGGRRGRDNRPDAA